VECYAVDDADEKQRPVGTAFCVFDVVAVIYGEEDVCCGFERGEGGFETQWVVGLEEHECHARSEENNTGFGVCV
jgi:hypothetical protein